MGHGQHALIEDCQRDSESLSPSDSSLTVGIDGGYVHARVGPNRKVGYAEVIAGMIITAEGIKKCFGFAKDMTRNPSVWEQILNEPNRIIGRAMSSEYYRCLVISKFTSG